MSGGGEGEVPLARWEGEAAEAWEARWNVPRLEVWGRLGSTNDRARTLAARGAAPFTTVLAEEQVAGRGRGGRAWASPPGKGLWMSVVAGPCAAAGGARGADGRRLAPILAGVAVCRAVERVAPGAEAGLKWPNDVLLGGRKVCGILCESVPDAVVVGIGVNVRQRDEDFPADVRGSAVSLEGAWGRPVSRPELAGRILAELRALLARPALRLEGAVAEEIEARDVLAGRPVTVDGAPGGVARGIEPGGALVLDDGGERRLVLAGTVRVTPGGPGVP